MKKILFISIVSLFFATGALANNDLKVYVDNQTHHQITIAPNGKWRDVGNTICTIHYNNQAISQGDKVRVLDGKPNARDGKRTFQGTYDIYDQSGNYLTSCTFTVQGKPDPANYLDFHYHSTWKDIKETYICSSYNTTIAISPSIVGTAVTFRVTS